MTEFSDCGEIRLALGVYVLGAIDPAERSLVDAHLSDCQYCRDELAGLAGLPALLGRVPVADVERLALDDTEVRDLEEPPAELLDSLLGRISARRRARRWRGVLAAAAAAVIAIGGGVGGGVLISQGHDAAQGFELVRGSSAATHVSAAVYYGPSNTGTSMQVQVSGIPNGTYCTFRVTTFGGQHFVVGGWMVNGAHGNWYEAASPIATAKIRSFEITADGKMLVNVLAT
ncbi:MAG TPA: zf-HC2 domain-containing protein [Streptosporangiaceae bacterium]|nr:zf-HC2 domain-containing protein [Streptosporangiaceae bacterium]